MADNFQTVPVPLTSGIRQDFGDLAKNPSEQLIEGTNIVITRKGQIQGRPGEVSRNGTVQTSPVFSTGTGVTGLFSTVVSGLTRAGIESVPSVVGAYSTVSLYQSRAFRKSSPQALWQDIGPFWSTRKAVSEDLDQNPSSYSTTNPGRAPCGLSLVGRPQDVTFLTGAVGPYLSNQNDTITAKASYDSTLFSSAAGVASLYIGNNVGKEFGAYYTNSGSLNTIVEGANPATTTVPGVVTGLQVPGSALQYTSFFSVCPVQQGFAVAAYILAATPTQVSLARINITTGAVTHTTTLATVYTNPQAIGIGYDSSAASGSICLAVFDAGAIKSRMIAVGTGGFTDTGLSISTSSVPIGGATPLNMTVGTNNAGTAWIAMDEQIPSLLGGSTGCSVHMYTRTTTNTIATTPRTLFGAMAVGTQNRVYSLLFQPILFQGRMVVGVQSVTDQTVITGAYTTHGRPATWAVLDITDIGNSISRYVVAQGSNATLTPCSNATAVGDLYFCVYEGRTFDTFGVDRWACVRMRLSGTGSRSAYLNGRAIFSGCASYTDTGQSMNETGWYDQPPLIQANVPTAGGSLTASASYSVTAMWSYLDGAGKLVRSQPATLISTQTTTGANKQFTVTVTTPQLTNPLSSGYLSRSTPKLEVYVTKANPVAGDDYYLFSTALVSFGAGTQSVTIGAANDTNTSNPKLYTGGGVIPDEPPPCADRGVAVAGGRVWVADSKRVYASKLLSPTIAPAWSTIGFLTVEVPQAQGEITALVGMDDKLLVICTGGVLVVAGPGYDDLGNGGGFQVEPVPAPGGPCGPRSAILFPQGAAYITHDGGLGVVDRGLNFTRLSRPVRGATDQDEAPINVNNSRGLGYDVVYLPGEYLGGPGDGVESHNDLLLYGGQNAAFIRVLDLETGVWSLWESPGADDTGGTGPWSYLTSVASQLWTQSSGSNAVTSLTGDPGADIAVNYSMKISTGAVTPGTDGQTPNVAWGRLRGVTVSGVPLGNHTLQCVVKSTQDPGYVLLNKSTAVVSATTNAKWPDTATEFRATSQRFSTVNITLIATPALAVWSELDLEMARFSGRAPQRSRS